MKQALGPEAEFREILEVTGQAFAAYPWEDERAYASWAAQTYFYVRHTTTMITMAASRYGAREADKFQRMLHHLAEERGHDQLLLNDLVDLGRAIGEFHERTETSLFYQNQYYMIQNEGPTAHLGYALLLEAMCAKYGPAVLKRVVQRYGKSATTFLDVHVVADQSHAESGFKELTSLDSATTAAVLMNMRQSSHLYREILRNCAAEASLKKSSAA